MHLKTVLLELAVLALMLCSCSNNDKSEKIGHRAYEDGNSPAYLMNMEIDSTNVLKETYLYSCINSGSGSDLKIDSLFLDRYYIPAQTAEDSSAMNLRPCMIFVFGGGFSHGARDREKYLDYFNYLASQGYNVVSIDYRLGLQAPFEKKSNKIAFAKYAVNRFVSSVDMAVEDLYNATKYVLSKSAEWGIDPSQIFISGSSAGAITVLQAEYELCAGRCKILPEDFDYRGAIAFSGAIVLRKGKLDWGRRPCPVFFFHGDGDSNVPFGKVSTPWCSLNGSSRIVASLDDFNKSVDKRARKVLKKLNMNLSENSKGSSSAGLSVKSGTGATAAHNAGGEEIEYLIREYEKAGLEYASYTFYSYEGVDHSLAEKPMYENLPQIMLFLNECRCAPLKELPVCQTMRMQDRKRPPEKYKIGVFDYFKSNYGN